MELIILDAQLIQKNTEEDRHQVRPEVAVRFVYETKKGRTPSMARNKFCPL